MSSLTPSVEEPDDPPKKRRSSKQAFIAMMHARWKSEEAVAADEETVSVRCSCGHRWYPGSDCPKCGNPLAKEEEREEAIVSSHILDTGGFFGSVV